jgi:mannose-1-phosphate guanylyltransferase/phosphomannomutase
MKAIILAAGRGERLRGLTRQIPKPMLKIKGEIILEHNIKWLKKYGVREFYINLHYRPDMVRDYFKNGSRLGIKIYYSEEKIILGTAGGVKKIINKYNLRESESSVLVVYGDNFYPLSYNLGDFMDFHFIKKSLVTIGLYRKRSEVWKSGVVEIDRKHLIRDFIEKSADKKIKNDLVNTGLYVLEASVFDYLPEKYADFPYDIFPELLRNKINMYGFIFKNGLTAIDTPELYKKAIKR